MLDSYVWRLRTSVKKSPQPIDTITVECRINRHDHQIARQGLGDEHSIERIAMRTGQSPGTFGIGDTDRQLPKALAGNAASNIDCRGFALRKSAEPEI